MNTVSALPMRIRPLLLLIFLTLSQGLFATDYYWVGGTGKWTDYKNHWATSSGGATFCKLVPTSADNVHFDANSFSSSGQSVTLDSAAFCHDFDWTGATNSPGLRINNTINVFGSFKLLKSMSVSGNADILFRASSGSNFITTGGKTFSNNISFTGSATWILQDSLFLTISTSYTLSFAGGNFYARNGAISAWWLRTDGTATRSLHLGTSTVKVVAFVDSLGTGLTFSGDTSNVYLTKDGSYLYGTSKMTFYNVTFQKYSWIQNSSAMNFNNVLFQKDGYISNGSTYNFGKLTFKGNNWFAGAANVDSLILSPGQNYSFGGTLSIKYSLDANGTCGAYIAISGNPTSITSSSATISVGYTQLFGMKASGGATFTANNTYDLGKNSGWTINVPTARNLYWIGNSGNWSDGKHWATSSGGSSSGCVPMDSDNVIFDGNSFTKTGQTVTTDIQGVCNSMNWTGSKNNPAFSQSTYVIGVTVHGSLTFIKNMSLSGIYIDFISDRKGNKITSAKQYIDYGIYFDGKGSWYQQDSLSVENFSLSGGDFYTEGFPVSTNWFYANGSDKSSLTLSTSRFHCDYFSESSSGTFKLNADTSLLILEVINSYISTTAAYKFHDALFLTSSSSTIPFTSCGSSTSFHNLTFLKDGEIASACTISKLRMYGNGEITSSNTIDTALFTPGNTYTLSSSTTQKIVDTFICNGTCSKQITLTAGSTSTATISQTSGNVTVNFVSMSYIKGTGGASFNANSSLDLGGNSGWTFAKASGKNFYWVGNSGNWSSGSHWALTSGGASSGCVPSDSDNVYFDANSFSSSSTVTVDIGAHCKNMDWTGSKKSPTFYQSDDITINGSLTFIKSMSFTNSSYYWVYFNASSSGNTITSASQNFIYVGFTGTGSWGLLDSLSTNASYYGSISFESGTLTTNGYHLRTYSINIGGGTGQLNLGSSRVITGSLYEYKVASHTYKFKADSSTFRFFGMLANIYTDDNLTFYNVIFVNSNANKSYYENVSSNGKLTFNKLVFHGNGNLDCSNTFDTLYFNAGKNYEIQAGSTQTIDSQFYATGTCYYTNIFSSSAGTYATFKKAKDTINISYVNMSDMHANGGAIFYANKSNNLGNNTGWSFKSAGHVKYYWVGNTGNWSDGKHWALSSGGSGCGCIPTDSDDVFFDANSFSSSGKKITIDSNWVCRNMDWSGTLHNPVLDNTSSIFTTIAINIYGSLKFVSTMSITGDAPIYFWADDTGNTVTTSGVLITGDLNFDGSGTYTLLDSLNSKNHTYISIDAGKFYTNNKSINNFNLGIYGGGIGLAELGYSTLNLDGFTYSGGNTFKFNADSSTLQFAGKTPAIWADHNLKFNNVHFTNKSGSVTINDASNTTEKFTFNKMRFGGDATVYTSNTYDTLMGDPGNTFIFGAGQTQTINSKLDIFGSPYGLCILESTVSGKQTSFYKKTDTICIELTYFKDTKAYGGASFVAGNDCVDLGDNNGWSFSKGFSCLPRKIFTQKLTGNTFCAGSSIYVPYTLLGNYNPTNNFTVQLSDSTGSFTSPDSIGSKATNVADSIQVQIPFNIQHGSHYRVRVVSDGPIVTGTNNGTDITINPAPAAYAGPGLQGICKGQKLVLGTTAVTGSTYSWKSNPAGYSASSAHPNASPTVKTIYTLTETITATGCKRSNDDTVLITPAPTVLPGKNQTVCAGTAAVIGDTAGKGYIYSWTSNPTGYTSAKSTDTVSPLITTNYYITVKNGVGGCALKDSVLITVNPIPSASTGGNQAICSGKSLTIGAPAASFHSYSWTSRPAGFTSSSAKITVAPSSTITYYLTETFKGCSKSDSAQITINSVPNANTGGNAWLCFGDSIQIGDTATTGNTYSWKSKPAGFTSTKSNPVVKPLSSTMYYLTETITGTGCTKNDSAFITKYPVLNPPRLHCADIISNTSIKLGFSGGAYTKGAFLSYKIYRSTNAAGPYSYIDSVSPSSATSYTDKGVTNANSANYYYYIKTNNSCNNPGDPSDTITTIILSYTKLSPKKVALTWNKLLSGSTKYYRILIDDGKGFKVADSTLALTYSLSSCYRNFKAQIQVMDSSCNSGSNQTGSILIQDVTSPNMANKMLNASVITNGKIQLDLNSSDSTDVKYYKIYSSVNGAAFSILDSFKNSSKTSYKYFYTSVNALKNHYVYKVTAEDSCGNESKYSNIESPVQLTATAGQMKVDLQWKKYQGYSLDTVEIQKFSGGIWKTIAYAKTTDSLFTDTSVICNTTYSYRILSRETAGNNEISYSDSSFARPYDALRPPAPKQQYSSVISNNKIKVSWKWNMFSNIKYFEIWRQTNDTGSFIKTGTVTLDSVFTDKSAKTQQNTYSYYVVAVDSCSANIESLPSDTHKIILVAGNTGGCKPLVDLSWNLYKGLANTSSNNYTIYRSKNGSAFTNIYSSSKPITTFSDTNVIEKNSYCYVVIASDAGSGFSSSSDSFCITPTVFPRPQSISMQRISIVKTGISGAISLQWNKRVKGDTVALGYNIYHATNYAGPYSLIYSERDTNVTSYIHSVVNTVSGFNYYYVVPFNKCKLEAFPLDTHRAVLLTSKNNNLQIQLNWSAYIGFTTDSVIVYRSLNGGAMSVVGKLNGTDSSFIDNNIRCDQNYNYTILAKEKGGNKYITWSDSVSMIGKDTIPPGSSKILVASVTATSKTKGSIQLNFTGAKDKNLSGYIVYSSNDGINFSSSNIITDTNYNITCNDASLNTINNSYSYYVVSVDSCGNKAIPSDTHRVVLMHATAMNGSNNVSWSAYRGFAKWSYLIERNNGIGWQGIAVLPSTTTSYVDSLVSCHVLYTYRVSAIDSVGGQISLSNTDTATAYRNIPPIPAVMTYISVVTTSQSNGDISLHWIPSPTHQIAKYIIYRNGNRTGNVSGLDSTWDDKNAATSLSTYSYHLVSIDSCGNTSDIPSDIHTSILLKATSGNQFNTITWTKYEGFTVKNYTLYRDGNSLATINASDTSFIDTLVICGNMSHYVIVANATEPWKQSYSNIDSVMTIDHKPPRAVHLINATFNEDGNKIIVSWNKSSDYDAKNYKLYRSVGLLGNQQLIKTAAISDTTYTDSFHILTTTPFYYNVQVQDQCGNNSLLSNNGSSIVITGTVGKLFNSLYWNPYSEWQHGVDHYVLYRKEDSAEWKEISIIDTAKYFKDDQLENFVRDHCYRVEAFENGGQKATSLSSIVCLEQAAIVYMPNAFTPKLSPGLNDFFGPQGTYFSTYELKVYDRWGELVYYTAEGKPWDGSVHGAPANEGVYIYMLNVPNYNNKGGYRQKGNVLILK